MLPTTVIDCSKVVERILKRANPSFCNEFNSMTSYLPSFSAPSAMPFLSPSIIIEETVTRLMDDDKTAGVLYIYPF